VKTSRFINILLNTLTKKEYTKLRILFYILSLISIIALIYFMWIMNNIIISMYVVCVLGFIVIFLPNLHLAVRLMYMLIICYTAIVELIRRIGLKKNIENKYNIYNKHKNLILHSTILF